MNSCLVIYQNTFSTISILSFLMSSWTVAAKSYFLSKSILEFPDAFTLVMYSRKEVNSGLVCSLLQFMKGKKVELRFTPRSPLMGVLYLSMLSSKILEHWLATNCMNSAHCPVFLQFWIFAASSMCSMKFLAERVSFVLQ